MRRHKYQQTGLKVVPLFFPFFGCREGRKEAVPPTAKIPFPETAAEGTAKKKSDLLSLLKNEKN